MTFGLLASRSMDSAELKSIPAFNKDYSLIESFYELVMYKPGTPGEDYKKSELELSLRENEHAANLQNGLDILWANGSKEHMPIAVKIGDAQKPRDLIERLTGYSQFDLYVPTADYNFFLRILDGPVLEGGKFTERSAPR